MHRALPAILKYMRILPTILILISVFASCDSKRKFEPETLAGQACECFEKQNTGTIDERLKLCLSTPINENFVEIHKHYYENKPADSAISNYMMDVTIIMIQECNKFYNELDSMYSNFYAQVDKASVSGQLSTIQDSISNDLVIDSIKIKLLHKRISLLTKARDFNEALNDIQILGTKYGIESQTHFAKAYIFRAQKKYDEAIVELDKAIESGDKGYIIFKELIRRKKRQAT